MSATLQTIIGAAAAIIGGFVGAWWQTSRADSSARRIRWEVRREQALLALTTKVGQVIELLADAARVPDSAALTGQYGYAYGAVHELRQLWGTNNLFVIRYDGVMSAMRAFEMKASELLPGGAKAMAQYTESEPAEKVKHFMNDVAELLELLSEVRVAAFRTLDES
jgi:hypothetical protein